MTALVVLWISVSFGLLVSGLLFAAYDEDVGFILRFILFCLLWPVWSLFLLGKMS